MQFIFNSTRTENKAPQNKTKFKNIYTFKTTSFLNTYLYTLLKDTAYFSTQT